MFSVKDYLPEKHSSKRILNYIEKKIHMRKIMQKKRWLILFSLLMILLGGCRYQWLSSPSGAKIAIPLFSNETFQYGLEETLTRLIKEEFLLDARLEITEEEEADLILQGKITHYFNEPLSEATIAVEEYRVRIDILVYLIIPENEKVLWEKNLEKEAVYSSLGTIQTEEEAAREASKKIGRELVKLVNSFLEEGKK